MQRYQFSHYLKTPLIIGVNMASSKSTSVKWVFTCKLPLDFSTQLPTPHSLLSLRPSTIPIQPPPLCPIPSYHSTITHNRQPGNRSARFYTPHFAFNVAIKIFNR